MAKFGLILPPDCYDYGLIYGLFPTKDHVVTITYGGTIFEYGVFWLPVVLKLRLKGMFFSFLEFFSGSILLFGNGDIDGISGWCCNGVFIPEGYLV